MPPAAPVIAPSDIRRLLLVKLSSLGDVVHALPLAQSLRAGLGPDVALGWVTQTKFAGLLDGNPHLSHVYPLQSKAASAIWQTGRELRAAGPWDIALDTQGLLVSGVVTRLSGAPVRVGFDTNREGNRLFLTHPVVPARGRVHVVDRLLAFCDALGVPRLPPQPQTYLAESEGDAAQTLLQPTGAGPRVGFIVGASTPDKAWPAERWVAAAQGIDRAGGSVVLLGGPGEVALGREIAAGGGAALDLTGQTPNPRLLASVLARCAVVVGGDSGPTHLAVAVGTPVVGLYGVTDPARTGPAWGAGPAVVLDFAEADSPPALRRPRHSTLPDAMARIPANAVVEAVVTLWQHA